RLLTHDVSGALSFARQLRTVDPSNVLGLLLIASAEIMGARLDEAAQALQEAIRLAPRGWMPQYLLGVLLMRQSRTKEAIASLRWAARNQTRSAAVYHALGVAYGIQGEWRK